ncbi:ATP-binding cassette domain-containing protein [Leucobacter massiliensis]
MWGLGYSAARSARQAELERWRQRYAAELAERERLIHEIEVGAREVNRKHESKSEAKITRKFYADKDARVTARRARNARVRLDALERERVRRPPEPLRFGGFAGGGADAVRAPGPGAAPGTAAPLLRAEAVAVPGRLRETTLTIPPGHRLMLTGPNGAGKSTLLAILAGELRPHRGAVHRGAAAEAVRIGYLPQEVGFADPSLTAAAVFRTAVGEERADEVPLGSTGLLARRDLDRPVGALSVGQRRRLALAALVADPPPLLLLDEPSNHLSLTLVEELEAALGTFPGALVIATHDRWLRARWRGDVLALEPPG